MAKGKKNVRPAAKGGVPKAGPVWRMSAEEATLARMPKYNGYACGTGAHGDAKYNRTKQKRAWQKDFSQEGARSCGFLPFWGAMDGRPFDYVLLPLRWHQGLPCLYANGRAGKGCLHVCGVRQVARWLGY